MVPVVPAELRKKSPVSMKKAPTQVAGPVFLLRKIPKMGVSTT